MPSGRLPVPMTVCPTPGMGPLSFVVTVSDDAILRKEFMASPCLAAAGGLHQVIPVRDGLNVIAKLQSGLERADNAWVVCVHQDVWLPTGWDFRLMRQLREAERRFGPIGVAGVYGVGDVIPPTTGSAAGRGTDRLGRRSRPHAQRRAGLAGQGRRA